MMRLNLRYAMLVIGFLWCGHAMAQQESLYTQYMFNRLVINPAYAGTKGLVSVTALYRHQWSDFNGAPRTFTLSGHGATRNLKHGFGAFVVSDQLGAMNNMAVGMNYAYRIKLDVGYLSLGLQAAAVQWTLDGDKVRLFDQRPDPAFPTGKESVLRPDFGAGIFFNTGRFYAGGSVAHLVEFDMPLSSSGQNAQLSRHYFVTAGYDIPLNNSNDVILTPSFFFRGVANAPVQLDLNMNVMLIQKFWVGASYRTEDAVAFLAGFYPHKQLRVGYSYDITTSRLNKVSNGSHEIMLSFDFGNANKVRVVTPRYF